MFTSTKLVSHSWSQGNKRSHCEGGQRDKANTIDRRRSVTDQRDTVLCLQSGSLFPSVQSQPKSSRTLPIRSHVQRPNPHRAANRSVQSFGGTVQVPRLRSRVEHALSGKVKTSTLRLNAINSLRAVIFTGYPRIATV